MKKQYSLKSKLFGMGAAISLISLLMGASNFFGLKKVSESFSHVSGVNLPNTERLGTMMAEYRSVRIQLRTLGIDGITPDAAENAVNAAVQAIKNYEAAEAQYLEVPFSPGEEVIFNRLHAAWLVFKEVGGRALANQKAGGPAAIARNKEIFFKDCPEAAKVFTVEMNTMLEFQRNESKRWVAQANSDSAFANTLGIGLIVGQVLFSLLFAFFMGSSLNRVFGQMTTKLTDEANEVAQAAQRISSTSSDLSAATTEQAAALQETASAIAEVSAMVSKNADNAARSTEVTRQSTEQTTRGKQAIQSMVQSIGQIDESNEQIMRQIDHSNRQMSEFVTLIKEIGEKTKVINDIVFQTKLLSFNASVEAARAGEHGKGFAVVAEEVGNLAQMSGNAAREISTMLEDSSKRVEASARDTKQKVDELMAQAKVKVQHGIQLSTDCSEAFEEIVVSVEKISHMVNEIAVSSQEQSQGVSEITKAIHQMDQVTQQNSEASQNAAADAHQLGQEAEKMRTVVLELNVVVQGGIMPDSSEHSEVSSIAAGGHSLRAA